VEIIKHPYGFMKITDVIAETIFRPSDPKQPYSFNITMGKILKLHNDSFSQSSNLWKLRIKFPKVGTTFTCQDREIVDVSISFNKLVRTRNVIITEKYIPIPTMFQFMIRRPPPRGSVMEPERGTSAWHSNWNIGEINEEVIKQGGVHMILKMTGNKYISLTPTHKQMICNAFTFNSEYATGWMKKITVKMGYDIDKYVHQLDNSTVRVDIPTFSMMGFDTYDIFTPETGSITIPAQLTQYKTSHPFQSFVVRALPTGSLLADYPLKVSEAKIRKGGHTMRFTLGGILQGNTNFKEFSATAIQGMMGMMSAKLRFGQKKQPNGWESTVKLALTDPLYIPNFRIVDEAKTAFELVMPIADGVTPTGIINNRLYDIEEPETISVGVSAGMVVNGVEQPFASFVIQPDPSGTILDATEEDIRTGGKTLIVWVGEDLFLQEDFVSNFHRGVGYSGASWVAQTYGWSTVTTVHLQNASASAHSMNSERTRIKVIFDNVSSYNIEYPEEIRIEIKKEAVRSDKWYRGDDDNGLFRFFIWSFPSGSLMYNEGTTRASMIRSGGYSLVFKLDPVVADTFKELDSAMNFYLQQGFKSVPLSEQPSSYTSRWMQLVVSLLDRSMQTLSADRKQLTMGPIPAIPGFDMPRFSEKIQFIAPAACLNAGKEMKWAAFLIEHDPPSPGPRL